MKKWLSLILAVALVVFALIGCQSAPVESSAPAPETSGAEPPETQETQEQAKTLTIGMSWAHKNDSLFYGMEDAMVAAMEEMKDQYGYNEVKWIHVIANDDARKQAADIEDLITQDVDLIVSYAYDSTAIGSSIEAARAAGIPFIMWDRDADPSVTQPDAFIGLDTVAQAYTTGVALFQAMKDAGVEPKDVISIIGDLADQNALNRIEGFKKAGEEFGVTIKQEVPSEWDADKALSGFSAAYQANPDCNCVLIASDFIITSVQSVLETAGKWIPQGEEGHIWVGSQDVFPVGLQFIRDGYIDFDGAYDLAAMAKEFAPVAYELVAGNKPAKDKITVAGAVISKANVDTTEDLWSLNYE